VNLRIPSTLPSILDFDTELLRYGYTSLATPSSTYDYNMKTRERKLLKQQEVVGGYNPDEYVTERQWATADDGTLIPMSIVYKKGIAKNGNNPTLIYGYGSYGASMRPYIFLTRLSLLTVVLFTPLHTFGVDRKWAVNGMKTVKCSTRKTHLPILLIVLNF
jgi:oligopeptidase B